jgi:hypothetical protein
MNWNIAQGLANVLRESIPPLRVEVQNVPEPRQGYVIVASARRGGRWHTIAIKGTTEFALVLAALEIQAEKLQRQVATVA